MKKHTDAEKHQKNLKTWKTDYQDELETARREVHTVKKRAKTDQDQPEIPNTGTEKVTVTTEPVATESWNEPEKPEKAGSTIVNPGGGSQTQTESPGKQMNYYYDKDLSKGDVKVDTVEEERKSDRDQSLEDADLAVNVENMRVGTEQNQQRRVTTAAPVISANPLIGAGLGVLNEIQDDADIIKSEDQDQEQSNAQQGESVNILQPESPALQSDPGAQAMKSVTTNLG